MKQAMAGAALLLLLAGCRSDPALHSQRIGAGHYRVQADRCQVIGPAQLEADLQALAARSCATGAGPLEAVQSLPSRQGSLFGECPRGAALRAEVHCR